MWSPPIALTSEEQKTAARTRKTRKFFVFLREHRHELLDADFQSALAQSYRPEPGGQAPVEAGLLALATLLQAYGHVGDRDAVELTVMDKRWQMVLACLGAEQPPFSQGTLFNFRMRLIAHNLDKTLLERTVALAETTGGFGARHLRAVLDSTPLFGAGRVEDTLNLLGHALRKAVGLAAQELGTSAEAVVEDAGPGAGRTQQSQSGPGSGLGGAQGTGTRPGPGAGGSGTVATLAGAAADPGRRATSAEGGHGDHHADSHAGYRARPWRVDRAGDVSRSTSRLTGASRSRIKTYATAAKAVRKPSTASKSTLPSIWIAKSSGRWWSARPMSRSMRQSSCWPRSWRKPPACCSSISIWGTWPAHGLPNGRSRACTLSPAPGRRLVRCSRSMISPWTLQGCRSPVRVARASPWSSASLPSFRLRLCDVCALRTQCTKATRGQGRSLSIREDEPFQQKLRTKMKTQRGRASLRKRTAVEHAIAHQLAHQGRRARYKGLRKNQFDGRRHAAVSNLQVAAHYEEEHRLAS